jgi:SAM-dependent methyltransferase
VPDPTPESARDHWERQADEWIALTHVDPQYDLLNKPSFLDVVPTPGPLTLDIGCGEGRMARELAARGHRVLAFDASPALARAARHHGADMPVAIGDISQLPIASGIADLVVCFMVLMDVEDLGGAIGELARVLAPDGALCVGILHPILSSGLFIPGDEHHTFYMGEYAKPMRHVLDVQRGNSQVFHLRVEHRPLEQYFRAFEGAGLAVTSFREPRPSDALVAAEPELANQQRVPSFLHLVARRAR